jgi:hypothetical protein
MTGTPLDLTPFGPLLQSVGIIYWLIALSLAGLVLWVGKRWWVKAPIAALILAGFAYPVIRRVDAQQQEVASAKSKLDVAMAQFQMRCKSAGEKIVRTVENVDGVVLMKWREPRDVNDEYDQFKLFDPYGRDCAAEECVSQLLRLEVDAGLFEREVSLRKSRYRFVEAQDDRDAVPHRYTGTMKPVASWTPEAIEKYRKEKGTDIPEYSYQFALAKAPITKFSARYGITWDDISTREDREHWVAGGSIKVIDLQTNEVLAEHVGFLIDSGQGSTAGFRSPWGWARSYSSACPGLTADHRTKFVLRVLQPTKAE